uniref:F-box domain-containing protein n=1 Tax=Panagrellus redivivus TaxID=6233 RepID=A0A7E4W8T3_PANRE
MKRGTSAARKGPGGKKKPRPVSIRSIQMNREMFQVPLTDTSGKSLEPLTEITSLPSELNVLFVDYLLAVSGETNFDKVQMGCVEVKRQYPLIRKVKAEWFHEHVRLQSYRYPREYNTLWFNMGEQIRLMVVHAFYQYFTRPSQAGPRLAKVQLDENQQPTVSFQETSFATSSQYHAASLVYNLLSTSDTRKLLHLARVAQVYRLQSKQKFGRLLNAATEEYFVVEAELKGQLPDLADTLEYAQYMRKHTEQKTCELFKRAASLIEYLTLENILKTFGCFAIGMNPNIRNSDGLSLQAMLTDALIAAGGGPTTLAQSFTLDSSGYCTREHSFSPNTIKFNGKEVVPPFPPLLTYPGVYVYEFDEKIRQTMFATFCQHRYEFHHVHPNRYLRNPKRILRHETAVDAMYYYKKRNTSSRVQYDENREERPIKPISPPTEGLPKKIFDWSGEKFKPSVQEVIDEVYETYMDDYTWVDFDAYGTVFTVRDFNVDDCISLIVGDFLEDVTDEDFQSNYVIIKKAAFFDTRMKDPNNKLFLGAFVQAAPNGNCHVCCYTTSYGVPYAMLVASTKIPANTAVTFYAPHFKSPTEKANERIEAKEKEEADAAEAAAAAAAAAEEEEGE